MRGLSSGLRTRLVKLGKVFQWIADSRLGSLEITFFRLAGFQRRRPWEKLGSRACHYVQRLLVAMVEFGNDDVRGRSKLEQRVIDAADQVLRRDGAVGPIELLIQLRFLEHVHVEHWKRGSPTIAVLEDHIQCGEKKLADTFRFFQQWAEAQGLETAAAVYQGPSRSGGRELRIIADDDPQLQKFYCTRYLRTDHSPARKKQIERKLNKAPDLVVFVMASDEAICSECGETLVRGDWMFREQEQPLCLTCADLDHLEFLPSGNATLSRRAKKFSPLSAVVVQFNRRRKRYERQGLLATATAIQKAEESLQADAGERAKQRVAAAIRRDEDDLKLVETMIGQIRQQFPACPLKEARRIAQHTAERGSGRVGRSAAGRESDPKAIKLAVIAHIRHEHTDYDTKLMQGVDRREARSMIQPALHKKLASWQNSGKSTDS